MGEIRSSIRSTLPPIAARRRSTLDANDMNTAKASCDIITANFSELMLSEHSTVASFREDTTTTRSRAVRFGGTEQDPTHRSAMETTEMRNSVRSTIPPIAVQRRLTLDANDMNTAKKSCDIIAANLSELLLSDRSSLFSSRSTVPSIFEVGSDEENDSDVEENYSDVYCATSCSSDESC